MKCQVCKNFFHCMYDYHYKTIWIKSKCESYRVCKDCYEKHLKGEELIFAH